MEIGSVAELVGAATSVIALFTAYWAFKDTRKMLENDTRRLNDEREDAEKRQATMVYSSLIGKKWR